MISGWFGLFYYVVEKVASRGREGRFCGRRGTGNGELGMIGRCNFASVIGGGNERVGMRYRMRR